MSLSRIEQETYFNFNEAEPNAVVSTYNASISRKLQNAMDEHPEIKLVKQNPDGYFEFVVPKKWCKVSIPRVLSAEEKQALRERALRMRASL